jgi:hypothetical protein
MQDGGFHAASLCAATAGAEEKFLTVTAQASSRG